MAKSYKLSEGNYIDDKSLIHSKNSQRKTVYETIENLTTYSTDEQVVGTWIDGKPIYRKAIAISSLPNNTTTTYSHDIDNFSRLVNLKATWYDSSDARWFNNIRFDSSTTKICFYCNTTNIIIEGIGTNWSTRASNCVVIIEYTKTTD